MATTATALPVAAPSRSTSGLARGLAQGALLGLAWGVLARAWMAYLVERPQPTASGTSFVVGGAVVIGASLAVIEAQRRAGGRRAWRLLALLALPYLAGAGSVLVPGLALSALSFAGRGSRTLRLLAAPVVVGLTLEGLGSAFVDEVTRGLGVSFAWLTALILAGGWGLAPLLRRWPDVDEEGRSGHVRPGARSSRLVGAGRAPG